MKIFQLIFSLSSGGAEKFTVDLSNQLSETNKIYFCVILRESKENSFFKKNLDNRITYINLNCSKGINFKTFITIYNLIDRIKPDIIHSHLNTILYLYFPALFVNKKIKYFHTLHSIAPNTIGFKLQKKINGFFYKKGFIKAIAISKECKTSFIEFYGIKNITLIENGVSRPKKSKVISSVKKELNMLKRNPNDIIFVHVARFSKAKNQKLLLKVFEKLIFENKKLILVIIGGGFNSDEVKEIKNISKGGINFLGARNNISDYLFNSDVFVLSSLWEGLPISLLEAISCGVIPVCTPAGGIPDVITDKKIGFISKDFTEAGLYEAIIKCIDNIDNFDRSYLIEYFNKNFSIEKCAKKHEVLYIDK